MIRKHQIVQLTSYPYNRPYQATYQVVRGRKVANMVSNWTYHVSKGYHAWVFDLRQLQKGTVAVDFRITSESGMWQGSIPRSRLPAGTVSFGCTEDGNLKMRGKYARFFQKVA